MWAIGHIAMPVPIGFYPHRGFVEVRLDYRPNMRPRGRAVPSVLRPAMMGSGRLGSDNSFEVGPGPAVAVTAMTLFLIPAVIVVAVVPVVGDISVIPPVGPGYVHDPAVPIIVGYSRGVVKDQVSLVVLGCVVVCTGGSAVPAVGSADRPVPAIILGPVFSIVPHQPGVAPVA